jgi:uncharacterized protein involved in exopolysaccharide biosynthesis
MSQPIAPRSNTSAVEVVRPSQPALPVNFSPLGGGDWDEEAFHRRRRHRQRWQRAGSVALGLLVTAVLVAYFSRLYEARSSVLIRPPSAEATVPRAVDGALASEIEILRSTEVVRQAIERVGVGSLYGSLAEEPTAAALDNATDRVLRDLFVRTLPGSDVIEVVFRHGRPDVAADLVNRLVERYRDKRRFALAPAVGNESFLAERIEEQHKALAEAELRLAAFHSSNPSIAAADPRKALFDRRVVVEAELRSLRDSIDQERTSGQAEDPSVVRARAKLDELELQEQATLNTHVEGSRAVAKIRHEIGLVKEYLASKEKGAAREQERRLEVLRGRQRELEKELAGLGEGERTLPELERQGAELRRERDVIARRLDAYQRQLETATLGNDVDQHEVSVSVRVLEVARAQTMTVIPPERARVAFALIGGAIATLLGTFIANWLENRRGQQAPAVWTAHVGAGGGDSSSVALLLPQQRKASGGPVVLLLSGSERGSSRGRPDEEPGQ